LWLEKLGSQTTQFKTRHVSAAVLNRTDEINLERGVPLTEKLSVSSTLKRDHGEERQEKEREQAIGSHSTWTTELSSCSSRHDPDCPSHTHRQARICSWTLLHASSVCLPRNFSCPEDKDAMQLCISRLQDQP